MKILDNIFNLHHMLGINSIGKKDFARVHGYVIEAVESNLVHIIDDLLEAMAFAY